MKTKYIGKIVNILLLCWVALTPLFWRLDLSKQSTNFYDVFAMAPSAILHLIVFYALVLFSLFLNKFSLYHILLLGLYFPLIQLVNYPFLTIRDVYLHAGPTETIVVNGKITYPSNPWPESWPASFDLHAILSIVSGADLVNANYILYLTLVFVFILTLYIFVKAFQKKGYWLAGCSAILFLCLFFNYLLDNFHHYSRTALGFTFLFAFFFTFMFSKGRKGLILQIMFASATITTHPFQSIALVSFCLSYFIFAKSKRMQFVLFSLVAFVGWFVFSGPVTFTEAASQLRNFFSPEYATPVTQTFSVIGTLPFWGTFLRDFFKYSLAILLLFAFLSSILILHRRLVRRESDTIRIGLLSMLTMSIVILAGLLLLPDWGISRFTSFAAFPAAFTALIIFVDLASIERIRRLTAKVRFTRRKAMALLLLFATILSAVVMVLRFERNYYYGEVDHPSELSCLSFFFTNDRNSSVNTVSWRTSVYTALYNCNSSHQVLRLWYLDLNEIGNNSSRLLLLQSQLVNQSHSVIRGMRDEVDFDQVESPKAILKVVDEQMIGPRFDCIYSNDHYTTYSRPLKSP